MTGHKEFVESRIKTEKDTLSEGVVEKGTHGLDLGSSLWEEYGHNQRKHTQPKTRSLEGLNFYSITFQTRNQERDQL